MVSGSPPALPVSHEDVVAASRRLHGIAHRTPVLTSSALDERVGARLLFKCENFQRGGAFKFRGAYNALARLSASGASRGAIAYSSGNHAQAMALAGRLLGVPVTVIMPHDAPRVKLEATRGYGAEVVTYDRSITRREELGRSLAQERGLTLIPPFDHVDVVAGQGTAARELIEDHGPLDALVVCCGGGGLLSGSALAARAMSPGCRVIGVEPQAGDDATRSFHSGTLCRVDNPDTIADGARTECLGAITYPLVMALVHDMVTVTDDELVMTMRELMQRMKIVVEPTGALGAAALLSGRLPLRGRVGVIVSGGNADPARLAEWLSA